MGLQCSFSANSIASFPASFLMLPGNGSGNGATRLQRAAQPATQAAVLTGVLAAVSIFVFSGFFFAFLRCVDSSVVLPAEICSAASCAVSSCATSCGSSFDAFCSQTFFVELYHSSSEFQIFFQ